VIKKGDDSKAQKVAITKPSVKNLETPSSKQPVSNRKSGKAEAEEAKPTKQRVPQKQLSREAQEVANMPDFLNL